ncbi:MAG: hypothetical protein ACRDLB_04575 [Actinomycetota bacterium]
MIPSVFLAAVDPFDEFIEEPLLSVAAVLLIVVSIAWIVMARLITREMKKAAYRSMDAKSKRKVKPARDIWSAPP